MDGIRRSVLFTMSRITGIARLFCDFVHLDVHVIICDGIPKHLDSSTIIQKHPFSFNKASVHTETGCTANRYVFPCFDRRVLLKKYETMIKKYNFGLFR